jgi:hypothetical protein
MTAHGHERLTRAAELSREAFDPTGRRPRSPYVEDQSLGSASRTATAPAHFPVTALHSRQLRYDLAGGPRHPPAPVRRLCPRADREKSCPGLDPG